MSVKIFYSIVSCFWTMFNFVDVDRVGRIVAKNSTSKKQYNGNWSYTLPKLVSRIFISVIILIFADKSKNLFLQCQISRLLF